MQLFRSDCRRCAYSLNLLPQLRHGNHLHLQYLFLQPIHYRLLYRPNLPQQQNGPITQITPPSQDLSILRNKMALLHPIQRPLPADDLQCNIFLPGYRMDQKLYVLHIRPRSFTRPIQL